MKILVLCGGTHPENLGGVETFERVLAKIFENKIYFLGYKNKLKKYYKIENIIEIFELNFIMKVLNKLLNQKIRKYIFKKEIGKIRPDMLLFNFPNTLEHIPIFYGKKILVQHGRYDSYLEGYYKNDKNIMLGMEKKIDYFVFLSEYDKKRFIEELNFPTYKAKVIRHSCEVALLEEEKKKNKNLIMIARLDNKYKRFDLAIKVMKQLPDFNLKIYGDGKDKILLKNLINKYQLKNVFLCDGTNKVKEKLDEAGIFIMTSDSEGYPISTIEAMRRGLPIILRNTFEAAQDIVIDNGILLEKEWEEEKFVEAVKKVYDNYSYYSENSIKMGRRHDFEKIESEWQNLIKKIENEKK